MRKSRESTSWSQVSTWYDHLVGEEGHYYHKEVILPRVGELLQLEATSSLLDLGCGQGIISRSIPKETRYTGIDISKALIQAAKKRTQQSQHEFIHADLMKPWSLDRKYSHAVSILALQNMATPEVLFSELGRYLDDGGRALFVLNHPCFRIPRQSKWGFEEKSKTQTRELFSYMSPQKIPITMHPGKGQEVTWSFHFPLSTYSELAAQQGFVIEKIEEWCSPKKSTGKAAKWENRARKEFPLFMALLFRKLTTSGLPGS